MQDDDQKDQEPKLESPLPRHRGEDVIRRYDRDMEDIDQLLLELFHKFDRFVYAIGDGKHLTYQVNQWPDVRAIHRQLKPMIIRTGLYKNGQFWAGKT